MHILRVTVACKKISALPLMAYRKKDDCSIGDYWWFSSFLFPSLLETFQRILGAGKLLNQKYMSRLRELRQQESNWSSMNCIAFCFCPCSTFSYQT